MRASISHMRKEAARQQVVLSTVTLIPVLATRLMIMIKFQHNLTRDGPDKGGMTFDTEEAARMSYHLQTFAKRVVLVLGVEGASSRGPELKTGYEHFIDVAIFSWNT